MRAFFYSVALQWKLDIRSRALLVTCYVVPLLFFAITGGIFTSLTPGAKVTLIQSMTVMGVSMGALIGLPPTLVEIYGSDIKKAYQANGVPLFLGVATSALSAWLHLMLMSVILYFAAPIAFDAEVPQNPPLYFASLAVFITVSLSVGSFLGLTIKNQAKLTMLSQLVFLPSILFSGILFPAELLPKAIQLLGKLLPASWGYALMINGGFQHGNLWPLAVLFLTMATLCSLFLKRLRAEG